MLLCGLLEARRGAPEGGSAPAPEHGAGLGADPHQMGGLGPGFTTIPLIGACF